MTKMVTDWFAGKEIATAMAIFVNSWPAGIAVSLLTLPSIGTGYGVGAVYLSVAALIACGIVLLAVGYRPPPDAAAAPQPPHVSTATPLFAVISAGLIWGLFNIGFAMIFSFGPTMLVERGWSIAAAGSAISIVLWLAVLLGPSGGFLADRTGRPQSMLVVGMRRVRATDDRAAAQRRGDPRRDRDRIDQRPARRADHEPARPRAAAGRRARSAWACSSRCTMPP